MGQEDNKIFITIWFAALIAFVIVLILGDTPSAEDIARCVELTDYTAERCEWEMTR